MTDKREVFNIEALEASQYLKVGLKEFIKAVHYYDIGYKIIGSSRLYCRQELNELKELLEKDKK